MPKKKGLVKRPSESKEKGLKKVTDSCAALTKCYCQMSCLFCNNEALFVQNIQSTIYLFKKQEKHIHS